MCPMRFNKFPLDEHTCKFTVGSSNYDASRMTFGTQKYEIVVVALLILLMFYVFCRLDFNPETGNTILDYKFTVKPLREEDTLFEYGGLNYSTSGFEMALSRNVAK